MILSRNELFARSILFGAITKVAGSLVVFVGLPIIAHRISLPDYAEFLRAMSVASAFGIVFGAAGVVFVRDLAKAASAKVGRVVSDVEGSALGLFIVLTLTAFSLVLVLHLSDGNSRASSVTSVVLTLAVVQAAAQWADAYRVGTRTDHISSVWQLLGNCTMFVLLCLFAHQGLWAVVLIYFGCPALAQVGNFVHVIATRKIATPAFGVSAIRSQLTTMSPMVGGSLVDYTRIFGAGALVALVSNDSEYSRYMTLILLGARLTNPLSLLVRPLVPAYLDAVQASDVRWLAAAGRILIAIAISSLALATLLGLWIPVGALAWVLPDGADQPARGEIVSLLLFVWGQAFSVLMTPLFLAANRPGTALAVNAASTAVGLLIGLLGTLSGHEGSMAAGVGLATASASVLLILYVRTHLLSTGNLLVRQA